MVPLSNPDNHDNEQWSISDSWYIGAFGKWWRGGVLEAWYQDVIAHSKDEESWSSGILSIKRLDMLPGYITPPFSTKTLPTHLGKCSPPRLRNRERTMMKHKSIQPRTQTPPLPKSVSLPIHSPMKPFLPAEILLDPHQRQQAASQSCTVQASGSSVPPHLPLSMERSPLITEVLRQLSAARISVQDLNEQLSDCRSSAAQSHVMLQHDVDDYRRRKRLEDITKNEIRTRTKGLEESKRVAEGLRKEAEKKLKTIQLLREDTSQHLDDIDQEIFALKQQLCDDQDFLLDQHSIQELQSGLAGALEQRRLEIKAAEGQAVVLNQRSRELEEKLASAKSRLKLLQGRPVTLKHDFSNCPGDTRFHSLSAGYPSQLYHQNGCPRPKQPPASMGKKQPSPLETLEAPLYSPVGYLPFGELPVNRPARFGCPGSWFQANDERTTPGALSNTGHSSEPRSLNTPVRLDSSTHHHRSESSPTGCSFLDPPLCLRPQSHDDYSSPPPNHSPANTPFTGDLWESHLMGNFDLTHACCNADPDLPIAVPAMVSPNLSDDLSIISRTLPDQPNSSVETKIMPIQQPDPSLFQLRSPFDAGELYAPATDGSSSPASTCPSHSLMRAFAPSPAERWALRRALGISTSTSFERLTSMSDIRTMPASPTRSHLSMDIIGESSTPSTMLPSWLSKPPARKGNFSPWADEDVQDLAASINEPEH